MRSLALTALGFVSGIAFCVMPGAGAAPEKEQKIETECRGNGAGGYRHCSLYFNSPRARVDKVSLRVFIDGEEEVWLLWQPGAKAWRSVRGQE